MGSKTLGNTTAPTYGFDITSFWNEIASTGAGYNPTEDMSVDKLWFYFGANSGTISYKLALIRGSDGHVLATSGTGTAGTAQQWRSASITPTYVPKGTAVYVVLWVPSGTTVEFSIYSSGGWKAKSGQSAPNSMSGATQNPTNGSYVYGYCGHYMEYNPAVTPGINWWDGAQWQAIDDVQYWDGSAWTSILEADYWNGSSWVQFWP